MIIKDNLGTHKVLITTAGIGSRLEKHTKYLNKSLVSINNKPIISHIFEQFDSDTEYVIALGYKGKIVKDFIELCYPEKSIIFCDVDPYLGKGSGLGKTFLSCKQYLQEPFIFSSCDTLVDAKIPSPENNWMGYSVINDNKFSYRTILKKGKLVSEIKEKGEDNSPQKSAYIGLAGIKDIDIFWEAMVKGGTKAIDQGESYGLKELISYGIDAIPFDWTDTGTVENLIKARSKYTDSQSPNILEKENESIWFVGDQVIKFSDDKKFIKNRVLRSQKLKQYVPEVQGVFENLYSYKFVSGRVLPEIINLNIFKKLLKVCKDFWDVEKLNHDDKKTFNLACKSFYKKKSLERINIFYQKLKKEDSELVINGDIVPKLSEMFKSIDWEWLCQGLPGRFHGDFHFENIIYNSQDNKFIFLDWRQEFAGNLEIGDIYYDFAKLLHGLIINHQIISNNQYKVSWNDNKLNYEFLRREILVECENYFYSWLKANNYDIKKTKLLTSLIFINIAPLHHFPYSQLLYALGVSMLYKNLQK